MRYCGAFVPYNQQLSGALRPLERTVRRACQGAKPVECRKGPEHGQRCRECGTWVRDDMTTHPFFGFKAGCQQRGMT